MAQPWSDRSYSGKVTAVIIVAVVVVFVLLNVLGGSAVPEPDRPVQPPTGTVAPPSADYER